MIELYQYPPHWGLLNASPFCMKLEVYLKLARIPYQTHLINIPKKSPSHKLPFIKDGNKTICDTSVIIDYLKATYGNPLDQQLSQVQQARAVMAQRLLEDHLYFAIVYSRWIDEDNWKKTSAEFFQSLPKILQIIVPGVIQKKVKKQLWQQGTGRLSKENIYAAGQKDLAAVAELLGNQPFFLGDSITSIDATIYTFLSCILYPPINSPLQAYIKQTPSLIAYCDRITKMLASPSMADAL
ncbi:MAG: glutathione S-transferase family protein [Pseudomonadota bacterium]